MGGCLGRPEMAEEECMLDEKTRVGKGARAGARLGDDYRLQGGVLGVGRMASVREGVEKSSGHRVAVKACSKKLLAARPARLSRTSEIEALVRMAQPPACPHIVRLLATYEDTQQLYLVLDLAQGGDLFHHIAARDMLSEFDIRHIMRQLLEAVSVCHSRGVVHRDLKPENIMINEDQTSSKRPATRSPISITLVDFGSAAVLDKPASRQEASAKLHDFMGTAFYSAPEVYSHLYGREADLWSVGAILYVLLTGRTPQPGLNMATIQKDATWQQLQRGDPPHLPPDISSAAADCLRGLLHPDPVLRLSAEAALQHPWLADGAEVGTGPLEGSIRGIRSYATLQKIRKVALALLAVLLSEGDAQSLVLNLRMRVHPTIHEEEPAGDKPTFTPSSSTVGSSTVGSSTVGSSTVGSSTVGSSGDIIAPGASERAHGGDRMAAFLGAEAGKTQANPTQPPPVGFPTGSQPGPVTVDDVCTALEEVGLASVSRQLADAVQGALKGTQGPPRGTPIFDLTELEAVLIRHARTLRSALHEDQGFRSGRSTIRAALIRARAQRSSSPFQGPQGLRTQDSGTPRRTFSPFVRTASGEASRKGKPLDGGMSKLASPGSSHGKSVPFGFHSSAMMRHAQSSLELSRVDSDQKLASPKARTPHTRQIASVHGEQLYQSAFMSLGNES